MKYLRWGLAALALFGATGHTAAGTVNANLHVHATLLIGCSVTGNNLEFGGVAVGSGGPPRIKTHVHVACPLGAPFQVGINNGQYALNGQRTMKHQTGLEHLSYELYKSPTGTDRFGDAIVSERVGGVGQGIFFLVPIFIYGEILVGQDLPAGDYIDNASVTVYF